MCEYSGKLIAWLDRELANDEMAEIDRHISNCPECRSQVAAYEQVSKTFDAYCAAMMTAKVRRTMPAWAYPLSAAGIAAVAAGLFFFYPRTRVEPPVVPHTIGVPPTAIVYQTQPAPTKMIHRHYLPTPVQMPAQTASWLPAEPAIQIAIPADSMFAPGAVPEGVTFTADVSISADGSADQIRLRPRLIGMERKASQP
jgi:hypothetical protein